MSPSNIEAARDYRRHWLDLMRSVADHADQFGGAELAKAAGVDGRAVGSRLRAFVNSGDIRAVPTVRGVWQLTNKGKG